MSIRLGTGNITLKKAIVWNVRFLWFTWSRHTAGVSTTTVNAYTINYNFIQFRFLSKIFTGITFTPFFGLSI